MKPTQLLYAFAFVCYIWIIAPLRHNCVIGIAYRTQTEIHRVFIKRSIFRYDIIATYPFS